MPNYPPLSPAIRAPVTDMTLNQPGRRRRVHPHPDKKTSINANTQRKGKSRPDVDCHGIPRPKRQTDPFSKIGNSTLLDKETLEAILVTQHADRIWIDTLSMMRRVHSTWNHVARSIYPEFTTDTLRAPIQEEKETWRSTFYSEKEKALERIRSRWEQIDPVFTQTARNVLEILRTYPATLDILVEAMTTLQWRIPHLTTEDKYELELFASNAHANTLYSTLSRHTLRPTPYAAQDLNSQIQEHIAATPMLQECSASGPSSWTLLKNSSIAAPRQ